jgi:hypothetical protein
MKFNEGTFLVLAVISTLLSGVFGALVIYPMAAAFAVLAVVFFGITFVKYLNGD